MVAKYDEERLIEDVIAIVKANFDSKIDEIQAEKATLLGASNFPLPKIPTDGYFDTMDDRITNYEPFFFYGIGDDSIIEATGATGREISIFLLVVGHDDNGTTPVYKRGLRYIRALREIFEQNIDGAISEASNFKVESILPTDVRDMDGGGFFKMAGISISTSMY